MAWDETLNKFGLATLPPPAQVTSVGISNTYGPGAIDATNLSGTILSRLVVGNAANSDAAVYIDVSNPDKSQEGIWAGSSSFSTASFSVDLAGNLVANQAIIRGLIETAASGQRIALDPAFGTPVPVPALTIYDNTGTLVGLLYAIPGNMVIAPSLDPTAPGIVLNDVAVNITGPIDPSGTVNLGVSDGTLPFPNESGWQLLAGQIIGTIQDSSGNSYQLVLSPTMADFSGSISVEGTVNIAPQIFSGTGGVLATAGSFIAFIGTSGGTLTLPSAAANGGGKAITYFFKDIGNNSGTNNIIIAAQGGEQIEFGSNLLINVSGAGITIVSDGVASWYVVGLS